MEYKAVKGNTHMGISSYYKLRGSEEETSSQNDKRRRGAVGNASDLEYVSRGFKPHQRLSLFP